MGCSPICKVPTAFAQWCYFLGFIACTVAAWALRDYGSNVLDFSPVNDCLADTSPPDYGCMGQQAVQRIAFGTFLFFALHLFLLLGVTSTRSPRLALHTGFWPFKLLLWGGLIASTFWMPNSALNGFGQAARVFSGLFIILQLVIILDFIYSVNEWLVERERCAFTLVSATVLLICGSLVGIGFLYNFYAPRPSCSLNIWYITSILLFFLVYGFISISPLRNESAGLFTSAAVFAYTTYYLWSALNSEPVTDSCSTTSLGANKVITIIGFVIAILALGYSTMSSGTSSNAFDLGTGSGCNDEKLLYRPDFFHCMFMLASCYMMMLLVGWDLQGGEGELSLDRGWGSTWVKIIAAWLCVALYTWSLIAHWVLKNRSF